MKQNRVVNLFLRLKLSNIYDRLHIPSDVAYYYFYKKEDNFVDILYHVLDTIIEVNDE